MLKIFEKLPEIVCEIGINHNGSVDIADEIAITCLTAAKNVGYPTDLIYFKFQKRHPESSVPKDMWDVQRTSPVTGDVVRYIDYKKQIELELDDYVQLNWLFDECGGWFVSVWDEPSVSFIRENFDHIPYVKIPSSHLTDHKLIKFATMCDADLIISTGMSTQKEIDEATRVAYRYLDATQRLIVMSCTATYPCADEEVNFMKLDYIRSIGDSHMHSAYKVGFSSHSASPFPAIYSNFMNVDMIEVHVTKDRTLPGSDQSASLEYAGLQLLLRETLRINKLYGNGDFIYESELSKRKALRGY
jgi:sialic acid synthase SpsE